MKPLADQTVLAIDPSINQTGAAMFISGRLTNVATIKTPKSFDKDVDIMKRCQRMAQEVMAWVHEVGRMPDSLVVEWPQVYTPAQRRNPNTLFGLCGVNGMIAGMLSALAASDNKRMNVISVFPRQWSNKMPKSKTGDPKNSVRARFTRRQLDAIEVLNYDMQKLTHDAIDAIGIGLWSLDRMNLSSAVRE